MDSTGRRATGRAGRRHRRHHARDHRRDPRGRTAVGPDIDVVGVSYLLGYLVPLFGSPDWLDRLAVFWAFGRPYLEWPPTAQLTVSLLLAVPGAAVAERTPRVA